MADQYWSNVVLALPMDGAHGSTTFTDISPTPKAVTRYGNAQISTVQSKFGGASSSVCLGVVWYPTRNYLRQV